MSTKLARRAPSQTQITKKRRRLTKAGEVEYDPVAENNLKNSRQVQKAIHFPDKIQFHPKTEPQRQMAIAWVEDQHIAAIGSAGTGKTFSALALALQSLLDGEQSKIVIVRSTVQVRDIGFLPGTQEEKIEPFTAPYKAIVNELMCNGMAWEILTKKGMIEFMPTTFMRGITIKDAIVILDEFQDTDFGECETLITRLGDGSRLMLLGDMKQSDLHRYKEKSGYHEVLETMRRIPDYFEIVNFLPNDCVRGGMVKAWLLTREDM